MANQWFRLWHDMPNDPKWRTIARVSKQPISSVMAVYLHLLVIASTAAERGRTQTNAIEDIASALDLECEQVDSIISAMQGRVLDGDMISGWSKRQVEREDGAAERAKAWREAKKQGNRTQANETERDANASERKRTPDTDTDTDTEEKKPPKSPKGEWPGFDQFIANYPNRKAKAAAKRAWDRLRPDELLQARMLKALAQAAGTDDWRKDGGRFVPLPATWINGRRWEDEVRGDLIPQAAPSLFARAV